MIKGIDEHKNELCDLCRQFSVKQLDVFGSALAGATLDPDRSDVDSLVEFAPMEPVRHSCNRSCSTRSLTIRISASTFFISSFQSRRPIRASTCGL